MALADVKEGDGGAEVNTETAHGIGLSHAVALDTVRLCYPAMVRRLGCGVGNDWRYKGCDVDGNGSAVHGLQSRPCARRHTSYARSGSRPFSSYIPRA